MFDAPCPDLSAGGEEGKFDEGQQLRRGGISGDVQSAGGGDGEECSNGQGQQDG